jgi:FkbM family methyltransferase
MSALLHIRKLWIESIWVFRSAADINSARRLVKDLLLHRLMKLLPKFSTDELRSVNLRNGACISYRLNRSDRRLLQEIWMERSYEMPRLAHRRTLVDLGANIGLACLWFSYEHGFSELVAVEPSQGNVAVLRRNLGRSSVSFHILEGAVGAKDGMAMFNPGPGPANGRLVETGICNEGRPVRVFSMDSVFEALPARSFIDLLKMDIEGGEQNVLTGDLEWLKRVRALVVEFHPALADVPVLRQNLFDYGFKSVRHLDMGADFVEVFVNHAISPSE